MLLIAINPEDEAVKKTAEDLYARLQEKGIDILSLRRPRRAPRRQVQGRRPDRHPGVGDLGAKSLAEGKVEVSLRRDREKRMVAPGEAVAKVVELLSA